MFCLNQGILAYPFFQIWCRLLLLFLADRWGYSSVLYTCWTTTGWHLRAHSQLNWDHPTVFLTVFTHCPWPAGRVREGARSSRFRLCHTCRRTGLGEDQSQHQVGAAEQAGDFWVVQQSDEAWLWFISGEYFTLRQKSGSTHPPCNGRWERKCVYHNKQSKKIWAK